MFSVELGGLGSKSLVVMLQVFGLVLSFYSSLVFFVQLSRSCNSATLLFPFARVMAIDFVLYFFYSQFCAQSVTS